MNGTDQAEPGAEERYPDHVPGELESLLEEFTDAHEDEIKTQRHDKKQVEHAGRSRRTDPSG